MNVSRARDPSSDRIAPPLATLAELSLVFATRGPRPAIVAFQRSGVDTLTYAELAASIGHMAQELRARGVAHGDRVALWAPNSPEWIVSYFAIVAAGASAVPLDHQATAASVSTALVQATPRLLITTLAHREDLVRVTATPVRTLLLDGTGADDFPALCAEQAPAATFPTVAEGDVASLLFTSGTTGTPKGVPLTHRNLAANTRELLAARLIGPDDRVLLPLPLHHTYPFTVGLLMTLASGATLVLPAGISGPEIVAACSAARVTALLAVPRLCTAIWDSVVAGVHARGPAATWSFNALLAISLSLRRLTGAHIGKVLFRAVHARLGGALDIIGCGGAKLPADLAWNLEGLGFSVLTGYGLTETSPVLTFNTRRNSRLGSEGRALPGVELRIADASSAVPGEILARGPSVFAGYWNDPATSATAFASDGWFRTGDLGRFDPDGFLTVVGRSKELIVLADGKKLFPETVEKSYASPLIREIGVFERGGTLAAVVVPDEEAVRARGALREAAWLREDIEDAASRLPPYQRITAYRVVRAPLPRTQLGKLRRHLLPALFDGAAIEAASPSPSKLNDADRALVETPVGASIWHWLSERYPNQVLALDTSPQFDLGIDSLEWVSLTVEIERRFGVVLHGEALSRILTLRDLLREIEAAGTASGPLHAPAVFDPPGLLLSTLGFLILAVLRIAIRFGLRLSVTGVERLPNGPTVIAPNHVSYLDPLAIAAALPWHRLRRTYWAGWVGVMHTSPMRRWLSRATRVFPIDPDRDFATGVRTAQHLLSQGHTVVWFPEGRRSPTGKLGEFQVGIGMLLQGQRASVVPTAIRGTFEAWPRQRAWPRLAAASVTFGPSLELAPDRSAADIRTALECRVAALLGDESRPLRKPHPTHV